MLRRSMTALAVPTLLAIVATAARAQGGPPDSAAPDSPPPLSPNYWRDLGYGAGVSMLLHEAGHILTALAVGGHPTLGFDALRPIVYSGLDSQIQPHKQFLFSAAGLTVQSLVDEAILDIPHARGGAFERGVLAGGIATAAFYVTVGRWGSVSDVAYMARTHGMTKTQSTLLFGGVAALHSLRIAGNVRYANFFARPRDDGGMDVGLTLNAR